MADQTPKLTHLRADSLVRRLLITCNRERLLPQGSGVLSLVSGGGDSIAMLLALHTLAPELDMRLEVLHVEHGLRGVPEKEASTLTRETCELLGVPFHLHELNPEGERRKANEETLRLARYEIAREIADLQKLDTIATAHTQDDLAETVLHRAARGTGLTGIAAMLPLTEHHGFRLIRPLLEETRQTLRLFLSDHRVKWHEDETNDSLNPTRNRIRHILRPMMKKEINSRADEALARLARWAAEDDAHLEMSVDRALQEADIDLTKTRLPMSWLREQSSAVIRRVLRRWLMTLSGSPLPPPSRHIQEIMVRMDTEPTPPKWSTFKGLVIALRQDHMEVTFPPALETKRWPQWHGEPNVLPNEGEFMLNSRWGIRVERRTLEGPPECFQTDRWKALIDANSVKGALSVRHREQGDIFEPLGMQHRKHLRRFMSDVRIPRWIRGHLPIICDEERIVWIAGIRIAEPVKLREETRDIIELTITGPIP